jgi:prepilin peptidase CpaA
LLVSQYLNILLEVRGVVWVCALALTGLAGCLDWRSRRIPNWLTVPGLFAGIAVNFATAGWHGAALALEGAGLGLALLLPFVLMRALGAGDWKLMGAVGAFLGPWPFLIVLFASTAISALMAVVKMIEGKRVKTTFVNMMELVRGFLAFGFRPHPDISLDSPGLTKLPFGVAVAAATILCFVLTRLSV